MESANIANEIEISVSSRGLVLDSFLFSHEVGMGVRDVLSRMGRCQTKEQQLEQLRTGIDEIQSRLLTRYAVEDTNRVVCSHGVHQVKDCSVDATPLASLFRKDSLKDLRTIIDAWREFLIDDNGKDALEMSCFQFDFNRIQRISVYMDLVALINKGALKRSPRQLSFYLSKHSNLSKSQRTLYERLMSFKKMTEEK